MKISRCTALILALVAAQPSYASPREPAINVAADKTMRLAEGGDIKAQAQLGWMYETGSGVPQNFFEAAKWYSRAAAHGNGWAQFELGMLYNKGEGVVRDFVLSYMWLSLSASQAVGDDHDFKARMRDALASKMTREQVAAAQEMARIWYKAQ
jgi:TPR repeat protein